MCKTYNEWAIQGIKTSINPDDFQIYLGTCKDSTNYEILPADACFDTDYTSSYRNSFV